LHGTIIFSGLPLNLALKLIDLLVITRPSVAEEAMFKIILPSLAKPSGIETPVFSELTSI
jgi:hypothetical protein